MTWTPRSLRSSKHKNKRQKNKDKNKNKTKEIFYCNKIDPLIFTGIGTPAKMTSLADKQTPRPTLEVDDAALVCNSALYYERKKALRSRVRISHKLSRVIKEWRLKQIDLISKLEKCSKKKAKPDSEDPSPYEKTFIFYCLND